MNRRPIYAAAHRLIDHGLIDDGSGVLNTVGPAWLGRRRSARTVPPVAATGRGTLNALTDQPCAVRKATPFRLYGRAESLGVPPLLVATIVTGAWTQPWAPLSFGTLVALSGTVCALATGRTRPDRTRHPAPPSASGRVADD